MNCATESGPFHMQVFCGERVMKPEYDRHKCDLGGCPLHGLVVPKALVMEKGRIAELHEVVQTGGAFDRRTAATVEWGLEPTRALAARSETRE